MTNRLTIYLAGKVQGQKHEIAKANRWEGVEYVCSDGSDHSEHLWGMGYSSFESCDNALREEVSRTAIGQLQQADMLFAYLDSPDSFGSIAEIAYFSSLGKPALVAILTEPKGSSDHEMFDAYWFVSCFPFVSSQPVNDLGAAIAILDKFLWGFSWGQQRTQPQPTEKDILEGYADAEAVWKELHALGKKEKPR